MSEDGEQAALIEWCDWVRKTVDDRCRVVAYPIGGVRHKATAARLKRMGARKGYPDLHLPVPRFAYPEDQPPGMRWKEMVAASLFIELKVKGGRVRPDQREWHEWLRAQGHQVEVCFGWPEAARTIAAYLELPDSARSMLPR